jgi:hypothetical protein
VVHAIADVCVMHEILLDAARLRPLVPKTVIGGRARHPEAIQIHSLTCINARLPLDEETAPVPWSVPNDNGPAVAQGKGP